MVERDPSFRPAPLTSFHLVFAWPSFDQHIFWVSNITLFCPAFQKVFVYYHLPWPVAPRSKISIYFEFLTLPSFVQHSQKFLFTYPINVKFVSLLFRISSIHNSFWLWITRRRRRIILYKINPSKSSRGLAGLTALASKRVKSKIIKVYYHTN